MKTMNYDPKVFFYYASMIAIIALHKNIQNKQMFFLEVAILDRLLSFFYVISLFKQFIQSFFCRFQVSAGQHLHLSSDIKGNVSVAAQQGMYFNQQQAQQQAQQQQPQQGGPTQHSAPSHQQSQQHNNPMGNPAQHQQNQQQTQQQQHSNQQQQHVGGLPPGAQHGGMLPSSHNPNVQSQQGVVGGDSYSLSQSQTINFTQQSLRQRATAPNGKQHQNPQTNKICFKN